MVLPRADWLLDDVAINAGWNVVAKALSCDPSRTSNSKTFIDDQVIVKMKAAGHGTRRLVARVIVLVPDLQALPTSLGAMGKPVALKAGS